VLELCKYSIVDLYNLKKETVRSNLNIKESFGSILVFLDFANVNYWFEDDEYGFEKTVLNDNERLVIDINKLKEFTGLFASNTRFYYGHDSENSKSLGFLMATKKVFGKSKVFTKPIQKVRHYLTGQETVTNTRTLNHDARGNFIRIPKCNFDVEICVDAIKLVEKYDTFCLFSSDADFVHLARFLKSKDKKIILVKGGYIHHSLHEIADLIISAQDIKGYISSIKQKPGN